MRFVNAAVRLFKSYFGFEPAEDDIVEIAGEDTCFLLGDVNAISYTIKGIDNKEQTFHHDFDNRPEIAISYDGKRIYILAGEYKFTSRGIVG